MVLYGNISIRWLVCVSSVFRLMYVVLILVLVVFGRCDWLWYSICMLKFRVLWWVMFWLMWFMLRMFSVLLWMFVLSMVWNDYCFYWFLCS